MADGRAASVSAYVASALEAKAGRESVDDVLAEWVAELGPPTPEEEQWIQDAIAKMLLGS